MRAQLQQLRIVDKLVHSGQYNTKQAVKLYINWKLARYAFLYGSAAHLTPYILYTLEIEHCVGETIDYVYHAGRATRLSRS